MYPDTRGVHVHPVHPGWIRPCRFPYKGKLLAGWGYTHDRRAYKNPYPHDRRADKDSYPHDRNVIDDLCSLIKLCFAFIMVNFST